MESHQRNNNGGMNGMHMMNSGINGNPIVPTGRDTIGADPSTSSGLLAGKRNFEGDNAAFDMKSLGKHIEAVSFLSSYRFTVTLLTPIFCSRLQIPADGSHLTLREEMETNLIRQLIASYFGIVRQSIQDLVPKAIMHFLVNYTSQHVQNRLVAALYKPELFADMLNEDEGLVAERTRVKALLDAYKEAFKTLSDLSMKPA